MSLNKKLVIFVVAFSFYVPLQAVIFETIAVGVLAASAYYILKTTPNKLSPEQKNNVSTVLMRYFDYVFDCHGEESTTWHEIASLRLAIPIIIELAARNQAYAQLEGEMYYAAVQKEALNSAKNAAVTLIAAISKAKAFKEIEKLHTNPPVDRSYLKDHSQELALQIIEQEITTEALQSYDRTGKFDSFIGKNLENQIITKVYRIYISPTPVNPRYQQPNVSTQTQVPQRPLSMPEPPRVQQPIRATVASENDIYEIYPDLTNTARNKEFFSRFEKQGKDGIHREDACPICLEDFKHLKGRVTLFCGHSLCLTDLHTLLYKSKNNRCPMCRTEIRYEEFSREYLNRFMKR